MSTEIIPRAPQQPDADNQSFQERLDDLNALAIWQRPGTSEQADTATLPELPQLPDDLAAPTETSEPAFPYLKNGWSVLNMQPNGQFLIEQRNDRATGVTGVSRSVTAEELNGFIAEDQEAAAAEAAAKVEAAQQQAEQEAQFTDEERAAPKARLFELLSEDEKPAKRKLGRRIIDALGYEEETGGFTRGDGALRNVIVRKRAERAERRAAASELTESDTDSVDESEASDNEPAVEKAGRFERIKNLITRGKEAATNKFSRSEDKKLLRAQAKADKLEVKRLNAQRKADRLYDAQEAKEAAALEDEAYLMNEVADAHDEALEMDKSFPMLQEAHDMNDAFDEAKEQAERQARIDARRAEIREAARLKADAILAKALAEMDKVQQAGIDKADNYNDTEKRSRIRGRIAQALQAINRQ